MAREEEARHTEDRKRAILAGSHSSTSQFNLSTFAGSYWLQNGSQVEPRGPLAQVELRNQNGSG
jgi:hypothetical protein